MNKPNDLSASRGPDCNHPRIAGSPCVYCAASPTRDDIGAAAERYPKLEECMDASATGDPMARMFMSALILLGQQDGYEDSSPQQVFDYVFEKQIIRKESNGH